MPTPKVQFESGTFYHVWTHANGLDNLFREEDNYQFFFSKYAIYIHSLAKTFAYCLMPNHFHLMIQIRESLVNNPSQAFSNFLNSYTQAFNKKYQRKGSLFIPNIDRRKIESDSYFTRCITYIHQNPANHGFVKDFRDWKFSSWKSFLSESPTKLEKQVVLDWFGGIEGFIKDHQMKYNQENEWIFGK
ncbi:transposase [Algoriphagus boritolerans]|uniref:Transposase IS200 like n=1 Tax=Algoriphagus boritolerans DSM 17298 = JCM 18970 TaxID=1120964 RepID=A0A1H5UXS4_9BACT|nr:transposase [Algoriphagus boritolerans]SEF79218.1 Transposase IS200 like [Algoriphagus boritolerans DSM 17298 = JCM 18970]